jgi:hypothetical protein
MAFQPSGFEPIPKRRLRSRRRRKRRPFAHLKAAPFLSPLEQNAWQRGYTDVPGWANRKPVLVQIATTIAGCGFGLTLGSTWWERGLLGAGVATAVFLAGLAALWLWHSATAPVRQRNEARAYACALEAHARDYAQWARRREIGEDFKREMFEHFNYTGTEHDPRTVDDVKAEWKQRARVAVMQLRDVGASDAITNEIDLGMVAFERASESRDDGYGDDDLRRVKQNMLTVSGNVWAASRGEPPPYPPEPPRAD